MSDLNWLWYNHASQYGICFTYLFRLSYRFWKGSAIVYCMIRSNIHTWMILISIPDLAVVGSWWYWHIGFIPVWAILNKTFTLQSFHMYVFISGHYQRKICIANNLIKRHKQQQYNLPWFPGTALPSRSTRSWPQLVMREQGNNGPSLQIGQKILQPQRTRFVHW